MALDKNTGKEVWKQQAQGLEGTLGIPAIVKTEDSADLVHSVYQDFHARVLCQNMAVSLAAASQPALNRQRASCLQRYKIHVKRAIGVVRDHFVGLVAVSAERWEEIMNRVSLRMLRAASVVRAGRSFERRAPRRLPRAQPYKPIT